MHRFSKRFYSTLYCSCQYESSIVYVGLKDNATKLLSSTNPKVTVSFPLRSEYKTIASDTIATSSPSEGDIGWMSKKNANAPSSSKVKKTASNGGKSKKKSSTGSSVKTKSMVEDDTLQPEIIAILDDSEDDSISRKRPSRLSAKIAAKKIRTSDFFHESDSCSENEF